MYLISFNARILYLFNFHRDGESRTVQKRNNILIICSPFCNFRKRNKHTRLFMVLILTPDTCVNCEWSVLFFFYGHTWCIHLLQHALVLGERSLGTYFDGNISSLIRNLCTYRWWSDCSSTLLSPILERHTLLWCRVIPPFRNQYFKIVNKRKSYWGNYGLRTHVNWSCFWSGSATNKFSTALSLLHWVLLLIHGDNHDMTKVNAKKTGKTV